MMDSNNRMTILCIDTGFLTGLQLHRCNKLFNVFYSDHIFMFFFTFILFHVFILKNFVKSQAQICENKARKRLENASAKIFY